MTPLDSSLAADVEIGGKFLAKIPLATLWALKERLADIRTDCVLYLMPDTKEKCAKAMKMIDDAVAEASRG